MSKIPALKKKAADLEKKSPDKAIPVYVELAKEMEASPEEMDVALFNRLGDLLAKAGNASEAADYYEKAVDYYTEGGFFNNAIALCSKILRASPGRATVYYKLGKINAKKGFKADAKKNFLEYADRMHKGGKPDEAFRALGEYADLVPDETDVRLMLAEQMLKAGKKKDAIEHLQVLHETFDRTGNTTEASATAARLKAIDPSIEPRTGGAAAGDGGGAPAGGGDLIFIDLGDSPQAQSQRMSLAKRMTQQNMKAMDVEAPKKATPAAAPAAPPKPAAAPPKPAPPPAPKPAAPPPVAKAPPPPPPKPVEPEPVVEEAPMLEIESTSLVSGDESVVAGGGLEIESTSLAEPAAAEESGALDMIMPDSGPEVSAAAEETEVPLLDLESPAAPDLEVSVPEISLDAPEVEVVALPSIEMKSVDSLRAAVTKAPEDWGAHRELAEALLDEGDRDGGIRELEIAMLGFERASDMSGAMSVVDEIVRVDPSSVKHHQKRVEYAYRSSDKALLVEAYIALADALFRNGQVDKSRSIYQRVLELSPDDIRAQAAISTMPEAAPPAADKKTPPAGAKAPTPTAGVGRPTPVSDDSFINLGDFLREDEGPKDTRMKVQEEEPTGNEEADFADMLKKFKQGVAENVEAEDYQSHYDLGVAFKEMGLLDEAIAEFQKALRGTEGRVRTYEAIGNCFIEKNQHAMAATILSRALADKGMTDDQLVGVLYLLGRANEATGKTDEALAFYQRVFVVDIQFQDVADRLSALENAPR